MTEKLVAASEELLGRALPIIKTIELSSFGAKIEGDTLIRTGLYNYKLTQSGVLEKLVNICGDILVQIGLLNYRLMNLLDSIVLY